MSASTVARSSRKRSNTAAAKDAAALAEWNSKKWVWIADAEAGYIAGWVVKEEGETSTVATESGQAVRKIATHELSRVNPPSYDGSEDIADLTYLNEASVVHNLKTRYLDKSIYTYSGLFLVAVNPYRSLPIYNVQAIERYKNKRRDENAPHVYAVAEKAWQNMLAHRDQSQSVLVTGESGAGKTENTKKVIQYLAAIAADPLPASSSFDLLVTRSALLDQQQIGDTSNSSTSLTGKRLGALERQILQANPILEAFGNAQTVKNNNSSRFGKFVRIYFNPVGAIAGANIDWYLLEKSRVSSRSDHERSFHVFFQLLRGADPGLKSKLLLKGGPADYEYLKHSRLDVDGMDDREEWKLLINALDTVGFTSEEQYNLFKVISAILHLGNIVVEGNSSDQAFIKDLVQLEKVCFLLGIDDNDLLNALVRPKIKAGRDWVVQARSKKQVIDELAAMSKALYEKNFGVMVDRINKALGRPSTKTFIGVLDIAGFEIFDVNGFEQLCINLTNEKLQQFFNHHMFVLEQEEYTREEIDWEFLNFGAELQPTIDLIESNNPMGILSCLDDACIMPKATDSTFTTKLNQLAAEKPISTQYTKYSASRFQQGFKVSHYAGEVEYRTDGWLDKNRDPLNDNLTSLLAASTDPHTARLFAEYLEPEALLTPDFVVKPRIRRGAFRTVAQRHKDQLAFLMTQLRETQPHFIRCIVPNLTKSPGVIDTPLVLDQLRCNGVLEGIRIARLGYPNRLPFSEFRRRFELLTPDVIPKAFMDGGKACKKMLAALELDSRSYKLGLSKVFFKAGILAELEERRDEYLGDIFTRLQASARGYVARRLANKVLNRAAAIRTIQRNARLYIELKSWAWWPLFQRVRPLLAAARNDDEMRRKEAELIARREQAEREVVERKRLENIQVELESQRSKMIAELASEQARSSESEALLRRAKEHEVLLGEELAAAQADLTAADDQLARAISAKVLADQHSADLTKMLSDSGRVLETLRLEQLEWKKKELELKESTSVKTEEWNAMVERKEKDRLRIREFEQKIKESGEDRAREKERLESLIAVVEKKLASASKEVVDFRKRCTSSETEIRAAKDEIVILQQEKKERDGSLRSKESELNRIALERSNLLTERDSAQKVSRDVEIRLAAANKQLEDQSRSIESLEETLSRSKDDVRSLNALLDDKVSDHQRQAETNRIAENDLQDLRARLAKVSAELSGSQKDARAETTRFKLELDTVHREAIESKRKNDELTRKSSATSAQLARAQDEIAGHVANRLNQEAQLEDVRARAMETLSKEREKFEKELAATASKLRLYEDATLRAERSKASAMRTVETLEQTLAGEKEKGEGLEKKISKMDESVEQQLRLLADFDKVNANLREELSSTQIRLRSAEDKVGKTVVEHIRVLEEAQRLQNQEIERMRTERVERDAYVRTLERARISLNQNLEDVQHEREAERREKFINNKVPKDDSVSRVQAAYESEKKLRQLAELNVARLSQEIHLQQTKLEASARETVELRRSNTLFERELNTLAASDVLPSSKSQANYINGGSESKSRTTPPSPTKGVPHSSSGLPARRRNYE